MKSEARIDVDLITLGTKFDRCMACFVEIDDRYCSLCDQADAIANTQASCGDEPTAEEVSRFLVEQKKAQHEADLPPDLWRDVDRALFRLIKLAKQIGGMSAFSIEGLAIKVRAAEFIKWCEDLCSGAEMPKRRAH